VRDSGVAPTLDAARVTVITATRLETWAARRALPGVRVVHAGIGLGRLVGRPMAPAGTDAGRRDLPAVPVHGAAPDGIVVSCGLAGALCSGLPTGSVVVPGQVMQPDGRWLTCDAEFVRSLVAAAGRRRLGPARGPLATAPVVVRGEARRWWAERGCVAVDMETGLLIAPRIAAVRVVLDTPEREISDAWQRPTTALLRPMVWGEAVWLCREAPRCARRAAAVLAAALRA
jgi:hypothetical protein